MNSLLYRFFPVLVVILAASLALGQNGAGVITTVAGGTLPGGLPQPGYSGDGGPASAALLAFADVRNACDSRVNPDYEQITHLFVDGANNLYFTDSVNQRIRKIDPSGTITTVAGNGLKPPIAGKPLCDSPAGVSGPGDGGAATSAPLYYPGDVAVAPNGNILIADQQANRIRQVSPAGQISTLVGGGGHGYYGPGNPIVSAQLDWPGALAIDTTGAIVFVEQHSSRIARVQDGKLVTIAGLGIIPGFSGDGGKATNAVFGSRVTGIAFDRSNTLYIADETNHRIRQVTPDGIIRTIAGTGKAGYSGDGGPASAAQLNMPADVKVDSSGNIYIADMMNHRVRRIDTSGTITTVAGDGTQGRGPDSVPATSSSLNTPAAVAVAPNGDLYIADWQNYLIRKVSFSSQPTITPGAVVNAASFAPAPIPVAPGSIISVLGANFAASVVSASSSPLPTALGGISLQINGADAPLYYVSPTQINAQVPFETPLGPATVTVTTAAGTSASQAATVGATAIGVFQYDGTRGIVTNQDGSLNGPGNPESRGNIVVAYLTGQGAVNPPVATGAAASATLLSYSAAPSSATLGGVNAPVLFLGLAPTLIGVAQANIQIPSSAPVGSEVVLVITSGGQASNTTTVSLK